LLHDQGFGPKLAAMKDICVEVPLVYLTATFPPTMFERYKESMCVREPQFIRLVGHKLRRSQGLQTLTSVLSRMPTVIPLGITLFKLVDRTLS